MSQTGPITKDTTTVALGLAQVRVMASATNVDIDGVASTNANSIGALADTKFTGETDWYRLESGYPLREDAAFPIREKAMLEASIKEITPDNIKLGYGIDSITTPSDGVHSGEVPLGNRTTPAFLRMEAVYTYPDGITTMNIIFPRCQITANIEIDMSAEEAAAVPLVFEAKRADSQVSGGSSVWDNKSLGAIIWLDA